MNRISCFGVLLLLFTVAEGHADLGNSNRSRWSVDLPSTMVATATSSFQKEESKSLSISRAPLVVDAGNSNWPCAPPKDEVCNVTCVNDGSTATPSLTPDELNNLKLEGEERVKKFSAKMYQANVALETARAALGMPVPTCSSLE